MAAELTSIKLNPESHLLLDQPLLRVPYELARRNFKSTQRVVEREREQILPILKDTANASLSGTQDTAQTLEALDTMIARMQNLKRKMETLHDEEKKIATQSQKRLQHIQNLYQIPSLADVKYEQWSRTRLNRLLADHMLRSGYLESAKQLAQDKDISDLVDIDVFVQCQRIGESLHRGETKDALQWCGENKVALKKVQSRFEFELRLQQYIELLRVGDKAGARKHATKFLTPHSETQAPDIRRAAGLLVYFPDTRAEPYKTMYSLDRWQYLSDLFMRTHHDLLSLSSRPLLQIALSAGLSALKTPACHSTITSSRASPNSLTTSICPICSTELNDLARHVPYAHHAKSYVEADPVVLPNHRLYGTARLLDMSRKAGVPENQVKDPITGEIFDFSKIKKVYIS
ncbi:GID complex subunit containing RING finger motif [Ophidiomyces ophidiicola]|nr:GID complex subunit containing RING finger motif [Ophidiomyces ophidiicola]KAI1943811.1 GID complex subunit containing RING finger motif [Ophidiomyces ophidiicola]KAI1965806.1 GID complex subunit containing RING finger motif [Ophidiomyces ophidiicola]